MSHNPMPSRNRDPLPRRAYHRCPDGTFYSSSWDVPAILSALMSGGWFAASGAYDFASRQCAAYAHTAQEFFDTMRNSLNKQEPLE